VSPSLDHGVRVAFQHRTIHEGAWVALVTVTDNVFHIRLHLARQIPLQARREASAAAAAQTGVEQLLANLLGTHGQRFAQTLIAAVCQILFQLLWIAASVVLQNHSVLHGKERLVQIEEVSLERTSRLLDRGSGENGSKHVVDDRLGHFWLNVAEENVLLLLGRHADERPLAA